MSYEQETLVSSRLIKVQFINLRNLNKHAELVKSTLLSDRFQNSILKEDIEVAELNIFVDLRLKKVKKIKVDE